MDWHSIRLTRVSPLELASFIASQCLPSLKIVPRSYNQTYTPETFISIYVSRVSSKNWEIQKVR